MVAEIRKLEDIPRIYGLRESFGDSKPVYYDHYQGLKLSVVPPERLHWTTFTRLVVPSITSSQVSCGVWQMYNLLWYPPSITALMVLCSIKKGHKFSTVLFSDTHDARRGTALKDFKNLPESGLWTKTEMDVLQSGKHDVGYLIAEIVKEVGCAGTIVETEDTLNRNTANPIKTYLWTVPYISGKKFDLELAIQALNDWRVKNGAQI